VTAAPDYYETPAAVDFLAGRYHPAKEAAYCRVLLGMIPHGASLIELGGGCGVHGAIFLELAAGDYTFSDKSSTMLECARRRGLRAEYRDAMSTGRISQDVVLALQLSTICTNDRDVRFAQFRALARTMRPGAMLVIGTARIGGLHSIDNADLRELAKLGLSLCRKTTWGAIPAALWSVPGMRFVEPALSFLRLGIRRIVVLRRI